MLKIASVELIISSVNGGLCFCCCNRRKRKHSAGDALCSLIRRQMCTFEGAHVNPATKIGRAKWGSPDIGFDSEHNRLSYGRLEHLHGCVLMPPLAASAATN